MISRRNALQALSGAVAAPAMLHGARRKPGDKPNLLFLWTDQQRADSMAAYGNARYRVPAMNKLASESIVFDRCYVTQPVCTPSRSSIMSGLWPHRNGCVQNNVPLKHETKTVPELLGDAGYRTGYMGKWHLGDEVFAQHGFEEWAAIEDAIYNEFFSAGRDRNARSAYHHFLISLGYKPDDVKRPDFFTRNFATKLPVEHSKPSFLAQEASKFILKHRDEPWILYVNTLEPHTPFASALDHLHTEEEVGLQPNYPGIPEAEPQWYRVLRSRIVTPRAEGFDLRTAEGWGQMHRNYAGLCSLVDQAWTRILWTLEVSGQMDNTIIVHTSDHGEMMGSHSLYAKIVMYEESVRVPLLLRVPFRRQMPHRVTQPVSHIDTLATLLELLGRKEAAEGLDGRSLVPALEGRRRPEDVFIEWSSDATPDARTVVTPDGWKLVLHDTDTGMLFDRTRDPLEMHNLWGRSEHAATVRKLRAKIEDWQRRTADRMPLPPLT